MPPLVLIERAEEDPERPGLAGALLRRAVAWGEAVGEVRVLDGRGGRDAVPGGVAGVSVPVLLAAAAQPRLAPFHAESALADLAEGADLAIGPALDGGRYLLALGPAALALPAELWAPVTGMERTLALAAEAKLEVGLLRPERALRTAEDRRAALADPLFPREIAALL